MQAIMSQGYSGSTASNGTEKVENPAKIIKELKAKADSNPGYVKDRLREIAKGKNGIEMLMSLAMMSGYDSSDLGSLVLEVAKSLVSQVEPIEKRATLLQSLISASRKVDGKVDSELLRNGFTLADQLRENAKKPPEPKATGKGDTPGSSKDIQSAIREAMAMSAAGVPDETISAMMQQYESEAMAMGPMGMRSLMSGVSASPERSADRLEVFLISQVAKDNFDKAIEYVHSRKSDTLKLTCLIRIIQSLVSQSYMGRHGIM
jgi:hypothetical protein